MTSPTPANPAVPPPDDARPAPTASAPGAAARRRRRPPAQSEIRGINTIASLPDPRRGTRDDPSGTTGHRP